MRPDDYAPLIERDAQASWREAYHLKKTRMSFLLADRSRYRGVCLGSHDRSYDSEADEPGFVCRYWAPRSKMSWRPSSKANGVIWLRESDVRCKGPLVGALAADSEHSLVTSS